MSNKSSNLAWRISDEFYTMTPAGSLPKPLTAAHGISLRPLPGYGLAAHHRRYY